VIQDDRIIELRMLCPCSIECTSLLVYFKYFRVLWRFIVTVTRWSRSTQLLYIEPG